ncbi:MAG: transcription antitermination protein NusB [Nannocystaceae bacterium]
MSAAPTPADPPSGRALGREIAFLAACHLDQVGEARGAGDVEDFWAQASANEGGESFAERLEQDRKARTFADELLTHLLDHWEDVDAALEELSERWRLARMDQVDRNVLRIACTESRGGFGTPPGVIAAESVKLAGRYGAERSGTFVNGLVANLVRDVNEAPGA